MKISEGNKLRILYFLVFCCTASWLPVFADYLKDRGLTGIQIGLILSVTPCMMFLVQPFYGMIADKFGYKNCLIVSTVFASLAYAAYLFDGGFFYLLIITVWMALFYNTLQPLLDSLSLTLAQRNPKFSYGSLRMAGAAGWSFTGIIVGHYIDQVNTTIIFAFSATSLVLAFIFSFSLAREQTDATRVRASSLKDIRPVLANKTLIFLLIAVFLVSAGATTIWNFYSIYMKENGASASLVGFGISFQGLCEIPFFYFSAKIISVLGMRRTLLFTVFATALRLFLYSMIKDPQAAIFIEMLHGLSWSLFWVVCVESVNKLVQEEWRATGQSILYASYFGVGAIVGNFWTGYLYDARFPIAEIFLLNSWIIAGVGVCMLFFLRDKKISWAHR
jgi:PPP family 3-phenylpropionic acid transporter